jgi:uncharacterized protein (TIGR03083 family)
MAPLGFDRYCEEIVHQTDLLRSHIAGADLTLPVPSCPGWNVGQLVRHLGGGQRWAATLVRTRASEPPADDFFRDLSPYANEDPDVVRPWMAEGSAALAAALRDAGPDAALWAPVPDKSAGFFARRFAHETLIHRADAALALAVDFTADEDLAIDAVDEWMELGSLEMHKEIHPRMLELLGPNRTLHFHASDPPPEASAEWVVDLTGEWITWRRAHETAAVAIRGPLVELLLVIYRRREPSGPDIEVIGDEALFDFWLDRVEFG